MDDKKKTIKRNLETAHKERNRVQIGKYIERGGEGKEVANGLGGTGEEREREQGRRNYKEEFRDGTKR